MQLNLENSLCDFEWLSEEHATVSPESLIQQVLDDLSGRWRAVGKVVVVVEV